MRFELLQRVEALRFVRFLMTGGFAAFVNIAARWALNPLLGYEVAVAVAYLFGMTTAFILARTMVFDQGEKHAGEQYVRFALVNALAFAQVWLVSVGLARLIFPAIGFTWHAELIAHIIGVMSPIPTSYIGHKKFSFR